jgi:hypothetical protein
VGGDIAIPPTSKALRALAIRALAIRGSVLCPKHEFRSSLVSRDPGDPHSGKSG